MIRYVVGWLLISAFLWIYIVKNNYNVTQNLKKVNGKLLMCLLFSGLIFIFLGTYKDFLNNSSLDMYAYYMNFKDANTGFINFITNSKFEVGYTVIIWLFKNTINNFYITLFFFYSLIFITNIYFLRYLKWNRYSLPLLSLYVLQMFSSFYILRSYLSICISLISIIFIYEKKYVRSFFLILLSISFHSSAVVLLPILILNILFEKYLEFDKKKLIGISFLLFIGTFFALQLVKIFMSTNSKYSYYLQQGSVPVGLVAFWLIIVIYCLIDFKSIIEDMHINKTLIITTFVHCIVIPLQLLYSIMYRMNLFFIPIEIGLTVQILSVNKMEKKKKYVLILFISMYLIYRVYTFFHSEIIYIV